jgi:hypothetical protein
LGVAFLDFLEVDFAVTGSFADFGVDVPFIVFGVFSLMVVLGLLTSGRGSAFKL